MVQKRYPQMTQITCEIDDEKKKLIVNAPNMQSIELDLLSPFIEENVHGWFSFALGVECKLVHVGSDRSTFSNKAPFLIINNASFESISVRCLQIRTNFRNHVQI